MESKSKICVVTILFDLLSLGSLQGGFLASDIVRGAVADGLKVQ